MTRLEKLRAATAQEGLDAILITSEPNLLYATRCVGLEGVVLITRDQGYCMTDYRYIEHAQNTVTPEGYDVSVPDGRDYPKTIAELCQRLNIQRLGFEEASLPVGTFDKYKAQVAAELTPVSPLFDRLREIKEEWEAQNIEAAQRIAEQALEKLLPDMTPGKGEKEMAALLDYYMNSLGSEGVSFSTIFVSGPNSSMPHGIPGARKLEKGDFVTIDFGAVKNGYHSDMTRTFAIGHATDEMKTVYNTVLESQLAAIDALNPGALSHDVHMAAANVIAAAGYGDYFTHGLGHSLGLLIHERPGAAKDGKEVFKTGNIITMEPGIYMPGKFGVRIEDMVYLAEGGKRNLTRFPKELTVL